MLFTSTVGFANDVAMVRQMKQVKPDLKVAFVGPPVQIKPDCLINNPEIDFIVSGEFDHAVVEYAKGKPLSEIAGAGYLENGRLRLNPSRPQLLTEDLDQLPFATEVYKRDLKIENYNVPFLLHPYVAFYTSRGCPAMCTFLPVAADFVGPCLAYTFKRECRARSEAGAAAVPPGEGILLR